MNNIMNKSIAFTLVFLCTSAIASEVNPFLPYQYVEDSASECEAVDPVEKSLSESGKPGVSPDLAFVAEVDGMEIYYDEAKDVYVEIPKNEKE